MYDDTEQDLRELQLCPGWCDAADHMDTAVDCGVEPFHFGSVGSSGRWSVDIEQPTAHRIGRGLPMVSLWPASDGVNLTSQEARSVAALLNAAADRVELNP